MGDIGRRRVKTRRPLSGAATSASNDRNEAQSCHWPGSGGSRLSMILDMARLSMASARSACGVSPPPTTSPAPVHWLASGCGRGWSSLEGGRPCDDCQCLLAHDSADQVGLPLVDSASASHAPARSPQAQHAPAPGLLRRHPGRGEGWQLPPARPVPLWSPRSPPVRHVPAASASPEAGPSAPAPAGHAPRRPGRVLYDPAPRSRHVRGLGVRHHSRLLPS